MTLSAVGPVALIGAGKMGLALARGWIAAGLRPANLLLVDPQPMEAATSLAREHGLSLLSGIGNVDAVVLVLAVKPQIITAVMAETRPSVRPETLVISIAAGVPIRTISAGLGTDRVIRTMPNTPAQIGKGITGAVAGKAVSAGDRDVAAALLSAAGKLIWLEAEQKLDAVTAVSGSGPAYVFHLVEALAAAGVSEGLEPEQAMALARQTVIGAAALMEADPAPASVLRQNVTSPKGTTEAALNVLMAPEGLTELMKRAVAAATRRSEELGRG